MYNPEKLEEYAHKIYARYEYFNNYTLEIIARRIKATGQLSAHDQQALKNIADITGDMKAITKKLAEITRMNVSDIENLYTQVVSDGVNTYKPLYDFKDMKFVPFEENDFAQQLVPPRRLPSQTRLLMAYCQLHSHQHQAYQSKAPLSD